MIPYTAPTKEMQFVLETVCDWPSITAIPRFAEASADLVAQVLEEAGKFSANVIAPIGPKGDEQGSRLENGEVRTPEGYKDAYRQYVEGGWNSLAADPDWGGQGLPFALATAVQETWTAADISFSLCPMLTQSAIEALVRHGTEEQRRLYLGKLISGEWTGTMNLTEPQAGSDVGVLKTRAEPNGDGSYRLRGQKIYITWGEHDMAENIVHMVLARTPGAAEGTKGLSLFLVPKFLPDENGRPAARNDIVCAKLEEKMGIHASPTCVLLYGENEGAKGWLVGEEQKGMALMFTMMNHARINVGLEGVAVAERATQAAAAFSRERVQSADIADKAGGPVPIVRHADVRRMLMSMRGHTQAARALTYLNAAAVDRAAAAEDADTRKAAQGLADLLTPVTKAYATDIGVEAASTAIQVHGGMGFIEETGVAQLYRDCRIAPIYEGTNGIQAIDLAARKLRQDDGAHWKRFFAEIRDFSGDLPGSGDLGAIAPYLEDGVEALQNAAVWLAGNESEGLRDTAAGATPFLRMFGTIAGGYLLARQAAEAQARIEAGSNDPFLKAKIATARYFAEQHLPPAAALLGPITRGAETLYALSEEDF